MTYCAYCDNTGRDYAVPSTPCSECKINETLERALKREETLQHRLNAADQRLDQAATALNEIARVSRMGEKPFEIATLAIGEISAMVEQPASAAVVHEGWQMVPVSPTDDMIVAFAEAWYSKRQTIDDPDMLDAYRDMLVVAPKHPQNL